MNRSINTLISLIFSLGSVFVLASCADKIVTTAIPDFPESKIVKPNEAVDPDLQLVLTESDMCLDQELIALRETGLWTLVDSPVTVAPTDDITYDFPVVVNKQVDMYLDLFQNRQRKQFKRWLARSTKYRPMMEKELADAGLPLDLVYLSMIESGFYQRAYSKSRAVGLWQFMLATGRQYHLKVDKYVDERRDAEKSTKAAVKYLSDLYKEFGDWHLAVAAYNGGPGKVRGGLRRHKVDNFWDLASRKHLKLETKRYVPKLIAAIIIAKDPEKYGFSNISYQDPLHYDTLKVGPGMSLDAVALISKSTSKIIKQLNQELRQSRTPLNRSSYTVYIPWSSATLARKNMTRIHSIVSTGFKTHKIKKGESLSKICKRYGVNKTTILKVNNLHSGKLAAGQNLRIPYSSVSYQLLPVGTNNAMAAYRENLILHRIKPGETVSKIAFKYHVPPEMIVEWNGLQSVHKIRAGQQLALYINSSGKPFDVKKTATSITRKSSLINNGENDHIAVLYAGKKKIQISNSTDPYRWYKVQNGDSLWTISRKFSTSTAAIKKWNNLKSNLIHPGSKLRLKKV